MATKGLSFKLPKVFNIIVPAAPISKVAFRGGGAKGAVYPGAIRALERFDILKDIDTVAGSSAGSIIALLVALGFNRTEIEKISREMNFFQFLDASVKNNLSGRGICDGNILYETFQKLVKDKVAEHIAKLLVIVATETLSPEAQTHTTKKLKDLRRKSEITFADIAYLSSLYKKYTGENTNTIKDLIVTGTNITDNKLAVFSAKSTPNLEVAKAIRISASYPIVFKVVNYNGKQYMDGGAMDNLPVRTLHQFTKDKNFQFLNKQSQREATLSFMLGKDDSEAILHHPFNWHPNGLMQTIKMYLSNLFLKVNLGDSYLSMYQAMHDDYGLRTIVLPTGNLSTLSFTMSNAERENVNIHSLGAVAGYFDHREKEGVYYHEKDFMSCLLQINDGDKRPYIYKYIARPFLMANAGAAPSEKEKINYYVKHMADKVFTLTKQKRNEAGKLCKEVKNLIASIAELCELKEDKTLPMSGPQKIKQSEKLKRDRVNDIKAGIKKVQKLYDEYLEITDIHTGKLSTNPRHREILNDRLQSQQAIFNELGECLAYYKTTKKPVRNPNPHEIADVVKLERSLSYFQLQKRKAQIIKILVESKVKYFQRHTNIKLLSNVVHGVQDARTIADITKEINKVKKHYKPRTFFSFQDTSSFDTVKKLDKALTQPAVYKPKVR